MLSDAAYGLILTTLCAIILKKYKPEGTTHRMIKMFMFCGLSTFMWGALFGGWFGNFFTVAAKTFFGKEFVIKPLWFDPLSEPMKLLVVSLILGAIHLFVGMGVQAYMDIKDGRPLDALFDIGLWYLLLIGIVLFAFRRKAGRMSGRHRQDYGNHRCGWYSADRRQKEKRHFRQADRRTWQPLRHHKLSV